MKNTVTFCTVSLIFLQLFVVISTYTGICRGYVEFSSLNYYLTNAFNSVMYVYFHIPFRIDGWRCCVDYKWDLAQNKCIRMLFFVQI